MTHQAPSHSRGGLFSVLAVSLLLVASVMAAGQGNSPTQLRGFIDQQVGGIQKLRCRRTMRTFRSHGLPMEALTRSSRRPRRSGTSGKCCFTSRRERPGLSQHRWHPRTRRNRVLRNLSSWRGGIEVRHAPQLCHGRGGARLHRRRGNFIARRRPLPDLPILRQTPLFPGDALVDALPTLTASTGSRTARSK